jgi:hypothetical protein
MDNMKNIVFIFLIGALLYSCNSVKVVSDRDASVDFSAYKTLEYYGWADNSDKILSDLEKKRIETAFGVEFQKRGFTLAQKGEGDMIVSLYVVTERKTETVANTTTNYMGGMGGYGMRGYGGYYGYGPGYGWGGGHSYSTTTVTDRDYTVGTLIISVYDAKKKELIWEAVGKKTIDEDPKSPEENVKKGVAKIMKTYPVQPQK